MDLSKICRLCIAPLSSNNVDLFSDDKVYLEKIKNYFRLVLLSDTNIPQKMCNNCSFELANINSFKERCIQAQKSLETMLNKCHYEILSDSESSQSLMKEGLQRGEPSSTNPNIQIAQNQFHQFGSQPSVFVKQAVNMNDHLPGISANDGNTFQPLQNQVVLVNNQVYQNQMLPLESIPVSGVSHSPSQFLLNDQNRLMSQGVKSDPLQNDEFISGTALQTDVNQSNSSLNWKNMEFDEQKCSQSEETKLGLCNPKKEQNDVWEYDDGSSADENDDDVVDTDNESDSFCNNVASNESHTQQTNQVTIDLVKKVKKEKLDVCEEMSVIDDENSHSFNKLLKRNLMQMSDELIVGSQMDDLLIKAVQQNENFKSMNDDKKGAATPKLCIEKVDTFSDSNKQNKHFISINDNKQGEVVNEVEFIKKKDKPLDNIERLMLSSDNHKNMFNVNENVTVCSEKNSIVRALLLKKPDDNVHSSSFALKNTASSSLPASVNPSTSGVQSYLKMKNNTRLKNVVYSRPLSPKGILRNKPNSVEGLSKLVAKIPQSSGYPDVLNESVKLGKNCSITNQALLALQDQRPVFVLNRKGEINTVFPSQFQNNKDPATDITVERISPRLRNKNRIPTNNDDKMVDPDYFPGNNCCSICDKEFSNHLSLKKHVKTHYNQKVSVISENKTLSSSYNSISNSVIPSVALTANDNFSSLLKKYLENESK